MGMRTVSAKQVNVSMTTFDLANKIENSQCDERAASQIRKSFADPAVDRHPTPDHHDSERSREQSVTGAGETCDGERFGFIPMLRPSGHDKWQPMRRDCSVQKSNHKSRRQQGYENDVVHVSARFSLSQIKA